MAPQKDIHILIVDDSKDDTLIVQRLLTRHIGHHIKTDCAENLKSVLDKLAERNFAAVLLDNRLGAGITAKDVLENFNEQNIDVPVIIITGQGDERIAVELMKMGAYDYITKEDLTIDKLEKAVFNTIEQHLLKVYHERDQQLLKQSEEKYRLLVENIPAMVCRFDSGYKLTFVNKAYRECFNQTNEQLLGRSLFEFIPRQYHQQVRRHYKLLSKENPTATAEYKVTTADGREMWQQWTAGIVLDETGEKIIGYQAVGYDITERKQLEKELLNSQQQLEERVRQRTAELDRSNKKLLEEVAERTEAENELAEKWIFFRTVLDNLPDHIYAKDLDHRFTLCNIALAQAVWANHPNDLLGKTDFEIFPRNLAEEFFRDEQELLKTSPPVLDHEEQLKREKRLTEIRSYIDRKDKNRTKWIFTTKVPLRNAAGEIIGLVGIGRDVTELKQTQNKLTSLASAISLAEERLRHQMAENIHSLISQNLAISKIKLDSLQGCSPSPEFSETLFAIRQLLEQTIESTRLLTFELSPPVLYELGLEPALDWLVRQTRKRDGLDAEFESDQTDKPLGDNVRVFLFQAVRELLVNVVKHSGAKSVKVRSVKENNEVKITVEDDGSGFDISESRRKDYESARAGFGLFSIRERLNLTGGHMDIKSSPGKGTAVTLNVPIETKNDNLKGN